MVRRCALVLAVALVSASLTGCRQSADLAAVRALAAAAQASDQSFTYVANDFYDSCLRQQSWSDLYAGRRTKLGDPCAAARVAARQWAQLNEVVLDYYRALGDIAGGVDDSKNDYGLSELGQAFQKAGDPLGLGTMTASNLARDVLHDIFAARRREGIATGVADAAPHVRALTAVLRTIAVDRYGFALGNESIALERFFAPVPAAPGAAPNARANSTLNIERYALDQLQLRLHDERAKLDARQAAIASYGAALDSLDASDAALLETVRARSPAAFLRVAQTYVTRYRADLVDIDKAFRAPGTATP